MGFEGLFKPGSRHNLVWRRGSKRGNVPGKQGHAVTSCRSNFVVIANAEILKEQNLIGEPVEGERKRPASWPWQMSGEGTRLTLRKTWKITWAIRERVSRPSWPPKIWHEERSRRTCVGQRVFHLVFGEFQRDRYKAGHTSRFFTDGRL